MSNLKQRRDHVFVPWSLTKAFFASSGGFGVDCSAFLPCEVIVFTSAGIIELARAGILPDISDQEVESFSKQDGLQKLIVCVQVMWFFVQAIARWCQHLPLTLLELDTIAHVFFALVIYGLWYKKPYCATAPYICRDERIINMAALFSLHNDYSWPKETRNVQSHTIPMNAVAFFHHRDLVKRKEHLFRANWAVDFLKCHGSQFQWEEQTAEGPICAGGVKFKKLLVCLKMTDFGIRDQISSTLQDDDDDTNENEGEDQDEAGTKNENQWMLHAAYFCIFSALYGSIYMVAWNWHFPTAIEKWMWRSSAILSVQVPVVLLFLLGLAQVMIWEERARKTGPASTESLEEPGASGRQRGRRRRKYGFRVVRNLNRMGATVGLALALPAALWHSTRLFFLVEAILSFRNPAPGTYGSVHWASFIPHIG